MVFENVLLPNKHYKTSKLNKEGHVVLYMYVLICSGCMDLCLYVDVIVRLSSSNRMLTSNNSDIDSECLPSLTGSKTKNKQTLFSLCFSS